jgi:MYXO-CTERM domain-containing protein
MIMTAASIISQAVPEPGTWAMGALLLGGVVVLIARRRAASREDQSVKV